MRHPIVFKALFCWLFCLHCCGAFSQNGLKHFAVEDLYLKSFYTVFDAAEDPHGYLWLGTVKGAIRFDGYRNTNPVRHQTYATVALERCADHVFMISLGAKLVHVMDKKNRLHVVKTQSVPSPFLASSPPGDPNPRVLLNVGPDIITIDTAGNIALIHTFVKAVTSLKPFGPFKVGINHHSGFYVFDWRTNKVRLFNPDFKDHQEITDFAANNNFSVISMGKRLAILEDEKVIKQVSLPLKGSEQIYKSIVDSKNRIWLATQPGGLYCYHQDSFYDVGKSMGFNQDALITSLLEDSKGNIWFFDQKNQTKALSPTSFKLLSEGQGLKNIGIVSIEQTNDKLWLGGNNGLFTLDSSLSWVHFQGDSLLFKDPKEYSKDATRGSYRSMDLQEDLGLSLAFMNLGKAKNKPQVYEHEDLKILTSNSFGNYWLDSNNALIAAFNSLKQLKENSKGLVKTELDSVITALDQTRSMGFAFATDQQGNIWLGGSKGLTGFFNPKKRQSFTYPLDSLDPEVELILKTRTRRILFDQQERMWVVSNPGIACLDQGTWKAYSFKLPVGIRQCISAAVDSKNRLWAATSDGLVMVDIESDSVRAFTEMDGMLHNSVFAVHFNPENNILSIGSSAGLSQINADTLASKSLPETDVLFFSLEVIGDTTFYYPKKLKLKSSQNNLRLKFNVNYVLNANSISYQYSKTGEAGSWLNVAGNQVELFDASYGLNRTYVRARIGEASWGKPSLLEFEIATPFFQLGYVRLAMLLLFIGLVALTAYLRFKSFQRKEKKDREMLSKLKTLEQQALGAMMNPHFVYNSLSSIQKYFIRTNNLEASDHVADLARLIRMNMDSASQSFVRLVDEVKRLQLYMSLEQQRFPKRFTFSVEIEEDTDTKATLIPSMVIQPFLENAIWHGVLSVDRPGHISLTFKKLSTDKLKASIVDNGAGIAESLKQRNSNHTSRGIQITRDRLALLGIPDAISLEERKGKQGTEVSVLLPVKYEEEAASPT